MNSWNVQKKWEFLAKGQKEDRVEISLGEKARFCTIGNPAKTKSDYFCSNCKQPSALNPLLFWSNILFFSKPKIESIWRKMFTFVLITPNLPPTPHLPFVVKLRTFISGFFLAGFPHLETEVLGSCSCVWGELTPKRDSGGKKLGEIVGEKSMFCGFLRQNSWDRDRGTGWAVFCPERLQASSSLQNCELHWQRHDQYYRFCTKYRIDHNVPFGFRPDNQHGSVPMVSSKQTMQQCKVSSKRRRLLNKYNLDKLLLN